MDIGTGSPSPQIYNYRFGDGGFPKSGFPISTAQSLYRAFSRRYLQGYEGKQKTAAMFVYNEIGASMAIFMKLMIYLVVFLYSDVFVVLGKA